MNIIQFLMDEDEVQDALTAYRTDPTEENKRRVIETILRERESIAITAQQSTVSIKLPHRFVLIPNVDTIVRDKVESHANHVTLEKSTDDSLLALAKYASRVCSHVHELGGSAVYVRFTLDEWYEAFASHGLNFFLAEMKSAMLERESLDSIADSMAKLIRIVGNMTDMAYSIRLIRQMYAVAENKHDSTVGSALVAMVDTSRTKNIPSICKEPEDENEEE